MDVWEWVGSLSRELHEAGRDDVVRLIRGLPHAAVAGEIDRADGLATELLAQARSLRLPWLEVFARHWRLQAFHIDERGSTSLAEATAVFEFAHREDTERCPQAVCVTQDLCIAYGHADGPGFAAEREAVAIETLERIDPSWGCWSCLTDELVGALLDAGRVDEAADALEHRWDALLEAGEAPSLGLEQGKVALRIAQGRYEDALALIDDLAARTHPGSARERKEAELELLRADALSRLGRGEAAKAVLPSPEVVRLRSLNRGRWVATIERLVDLGALTNDARLGAMVHEIVGHARAGGAWRRWFDTAGTEARLAAGRGARWVADDALATMRAAQTELRADAGAGAQLAATEVRVAALDAAAPELPVAPQDLVEHLHQLDDHDLEREVEWLRRAVSLRPEDDELVILQAQLLGACGRDDLARELLEDTLDRRPDAEPVANLLGEVALRTGAPADVQTVADRIGVRFPVQADWIRARQAAAAQRWAEVAARAAAIVAAEPDAVNTRRLWAKAARELGDHELAVRLRTEVVHLEAPERSRPDHWELMVDATIAGRWDIVHESARAVGMELASTSGPIDERWERVAIEFDRTDGANQVVAATRTGPVTARVLSISATNDPQRVDDLVVFDPEPLAMPPEDADDEARRSFVYRYAAVATIAQGGFTGWVIDGVDPGAEPYWSLSGALGAAGVKIWIYSDATYRITDPASPAGDGLPGLYGRIATPAGMTPAEADALLTSVTAGWDGPLAWIELARAAGADVDRHQRIIDAYRL